jgi:hypothetical protein
MELPEDVWFQIMMEADYQTIKKLSTTDKYAQHLYYDNQFWKLKVEKDYPFAIDYSDNYHTLYDKLYNFFKIQAFLIKPSFADQIHHVLINHVASLLAIASKPLKEQKPLKLTIVNNTLKHIFDIIGNVDDMTKMNIEFVVGSVISMYIKEFNLKLKLY